MMAFCGPVAAAAETAAFVTTVDGEVRMGPVSHIVDKVVFQTEKTKTKTPLGQLLRLETGHPPVNRRIKSLVTLTNGDRLAVDIVQMQDEKLICQTATGDDLVIPIEYVRAFALQYPRSAKQCMTLINTFAAHRATDDIFLLQNGDRISGELLNLTANEATLQTGKNEFKAPRSGVRAVAMNVDLAAEFRLPDVYFILLLTDGSSISVSTLHLVEDQLRTTTLFDSPLEVSFRNVAAIFARGGRIVPLSKIKPITWDYTPFISGTRELKIDKNSAGNDLQLSGRRYPHGLGMHSRCAARFQLDNDYTALVADFGIDDQADGQGSVEFRIKVDDRIVLRKTVEGRIARQSTGFISLKNAQELTLEADYAGRGDLFDIANWCEPVCIRKSLTKPN